MRSATPPLVLNHPAPGSLRSEQEVASKARITDHSVPADFTELFDRYYGYIVRLINRKGIHPNDVEDVAQAILLHFYRRDSLNHFDPSYRTKANGAEFEARFTTFLSGFVVTYLQHYLSSQARDQSRAALRIDETGDPLSEESWANTRGPRVEADHSEVEYHELVGTIHARLATVKTRPNSTCDLVALFEAMREQIALTGTYDSAALAASFNVPVSTIQNWIKRLRTELTGL